MSQLVQIMETQDDGRDGCLISIWQAQFVLVWTIMDGHGPVATQTRLEIKLSLQQLSSFSYCQSTSSPHLTLGPRVVFLHSQPRPGTRLCPRFKFLGFRKMRMAKSTRGNQIRGKRVRREDFAQRQARNPTTEGKRWASWPPLSRSG